jgi:alkylhydroperoxidase family enzyme
MTGNMRPRWTDFLTSDGDGSGYDGRMSWIRTVAEEDARGELAELYAEGRDPANGRVDEILRVHSLHPGGLRGHLALYRAVMRGTRTLPRIERELVALVTSRLNRCRY